MSTLFYLLIALLLLGILITIHEFGHFITARLCGIAVREYAIGMGPKLISRTSKKTGTVFSLRALPLGGFCSFYGEDDIEGKEQEDPRAFGKAAVWKRMLTVLMGPGMNFLLAFVVLFLWFAIGGVQTATEVQPFIISVDAEGPAAESGLQEGDLLLRVNGETAGGASLDGVMAIITAWKEGDAPLALDVQRGDEELTLKMTPFYDEELGRYRVGVTLGGRVIGTERTAVSIGDALRYSWDNCVYAGGTILRALRALVTTGEGLDQTSGPIGVVSLVSEEVRAGGFEAFLNLLVVISINLGIMNLLPIPGLDGSRFLFLVLEAIRRKPLPAKREAMVNMVGMALLLALMVFFTYKDIAKLLQ